MNGMIIYKSKYGATAQYAKWLGEDLALPVSITENTNEQNLQNKGYVLIGTSVYIGKLLIKKWLQKNSKVLKNKKIFFFVVCGSVADVPQHEAIINRNIPDILRKQADVFFLPGRLIKKKLSLKDRLLLTMGALLEKNPVKKNAMRSDIDGIERSALAGIIRSVSFYTAGKLFISNAGNEKSA